MMPLSVYGKTCPLYREAWDSQMLPEKRVGRRPLDRIPRGGSKLTTLEEVLEALPSGGVVSYPHYYRTGDRGLEQVVAVLTRLGKKGIVLYGNAFFDHVDPWLMQAVSDGVITGLYGNPYRKMGQALSGGALLPGVSVGFSHGNRVRKLQTGEVHVDLAVIPVPMADVFGNASGLMGKPEEWCGPLGLAHADAQYADRVCLLAGTVSPRMIQPAALSMEDVDAVVPFETPGLASGIGSGTLDLDRVRANPFNQKVADQVMRVMRASGVIAPEFAFQVGSGAGLGVLDSLRSELRSQSIVAGMAIGGVTSLHVDMLQEGTLRHLLHGQLFEPSEKVVQSLLHDAGHVEITAGSYASLAGKEAAVNLLDVAVLSALEVDRQFNLNTVCAGGRIVGGIGGGQDVAAGAALTIIFLPLASGKDGKGFPKVVDQVYTRTTPGEVVDVVVTDGGVSVNPQSSSPHLPRLLEEAARHGLDLLGMDELVDRSRQAAEAMGRVITTRPPAEGEVVHLIEWRDGTLLDVIRRT